MSLFQENCSIISYFIVIESYLLAGVTGSHDSCFTGQNKRIPIFRNKMCNTYRISGTILEHFHCSLL